MTSRFRLFVRPAVVTVVTVLAAALVAGCDATGDDDDWVTANRDDLILGVDIEGTLEAVDSDVIGPPSIPDVRSFKIAKLTAEGDEVKKGELVLSLDKSELERKLREKQNERDAARKELEKKRQSVRMAAREHKLALAEAEAALRKAELKAEQPAQLTATIDIRKAKLDVELERERVAYLKDKARHVGRRDQAEISAMVDKTRRAEQRVAEIQAYLDRLDIKAPRAGTAIYVTNWRGEKKKIGDNVWWVEKVMEIVTLDQMKAEGIVAEVHASKVAVGQPVTLRLDALPDVEFTGRVSTIADTVQRKSAEIPLQVARMEITLETTDSQRMRPGMRFRGTVETGRVENALIIPIAAVFISDSGPVAYRATDGGFETVKLEIGARNQTSVQILDGLREGDRVSRVDRGRSVRPGGAL